MAGRKGYSEKFEIKKITSINPLVLQNISVYRKEDDCFEGKRNNEQSRAVASAQ